MKPITCLSDVINHVPRVRVIKVGDENYGKEFDIAINTYEDKEVTIIGKHAYDYVRYSYSEIQFLTPIQYKGRYIGLGDKVNGGEVFGYHYRNDGWNVEISDEDIMMYTSDEIYSFQPLHQITLKIELSTEEMIEELKRRGVDFADLF